MKITLNDRNFWIINLMNQPIKFQYEPPKFLTKRMRRRYNKTLGTIIFSGLARTPNYNQDMNIDQPTL